MAEGGSGRRLAVWAASGLVVIASAAAMIWMWRGGGVQLQPTAEAQAPVEECNATISGSTVMTERLAPDVAAAFLRASGYEVQAPQALAVNETRVVGSRGALRCSITIRKARATQGLQDLAERKALIALSLRPLNNRDAIMLRNAGAGDFLQDRARAEHVVAFDAYAVVVSAANPVRVLSTDAIRDIVLGFKHNWSEVGGPDAPFTLYTPRDGVGPDDYPNDLVPYENPAWQEARQNSRVFPTEIETVAALAQDPAGFGSISSAFVRGAPGVRAVDVTSTRGPAHGPTAENVRAELYPFVRRLFVYVRPADMQASSFVQRFVAFFSSPAAYDLIDRAGFVALRPDSRVSRAAPQLSGCRFGTPEYAALVSATAGASRLPAELHFVPGTIRLDEEAERYVATRASELRTQLLSGDRVLLVGHTDVSGDWGRNRTLALRRALSVRAAFEEEGVLGLEVESAGEVCPSGDNENPEGRERNRRVEIWVRPQSRG